MVIDKYLQNPLSDWMKYENSENDIVISSRIRLARNIKNYPFSLKINATQTENLINEIKTFAESERIQKEDKMDLFLTKNLSELQKRVLVEKHLISLNFENDTKNGALLINEKESISVMINEEDHIRIQCLYPGLKIYDAWNLASKTDDIFEQSFDYAFDEKIGYLTSCPTNSGTGLRASVMVHIPALVLTEQINRILPAINQVGLVVRGMYGEGSDSQGNLFQISNQITLGQSEEEIIENLHSVINQVIELEKQARNKLTSENLYQLEDLVGRSFGILSNAKILSSKEATKRFSDLRLGKDLQMIEGITNSILNELSVSTQPGFLQLKANKNLTANERDFLRAKVVRTRIANI